MRFSILLVLGLMCSCTAYVDSDYLEELSEWKKTRRTGLEAPDSYLSLDGLFWLSDGENRYGSNETLQFPTNTPAHLGIYQVHGDSVFHYSRDTLVAYPYINDSVRQQSFETYSWYVIKRGGRFAIRMKNSESDALKNFGSLEYFPVDPKWNTLAILLPFDEPRILQIENIIGYMSPTSSPGQLRFTVDGKEYVLDALEEDGQLFIIFGDRTNGTMTYGGGRYLKADPPDADGLVALDFNRSYNPPCVFTPYATCPLPPKQNILPVEVRAGEKLYDLAL